MKKERFDNIIRDNIITKTGKDCFGMLFLILQKGIISIMIISLFLSLLRT